MTKVFNTKRQCPRCGGSIYLEEDLYGCYENCLQCGYIRYPDTGDSAEERAIENAFIPASTVAGVR